MHLIDHSSCGAPAFVQISTVGEGTASVFVNLRKYCSALKQPPSPPFTSGGVVLSLMDCGQKVRADPLPWLTAKFLCYSSEREVRGLDERQQRSHCGSFKFCHGVVDQGKRFLLFSMWQKSLEVLSSFTKRNWEVSFHCLAPSPISPALRTLWAGQ